MRRRIVIGLVLVGVAVLAVRLAMVAGDLPAVATAARMETLRADQPLLRAFLGRMPKGGDLHTHLSGAVYAERFIAWGLADGLCLRRADMSLLPPPAGAGPQQPCGADPGLVPLAEAVSGPKGQRDHDLLINALSMRWYLPSPETPSGHDQFFSTFSRFNAATGGADWPRTLARLADMTADQLRQYAAENVQYAEFMVTLFEGEDRQRLASAIGEAREPAAMLAAVRAAGLDAVVAARASDLGDLVRRVESLLGCSPARSEPGCGVTWRFIAQVNRNGAPAEVFAQTALNAALVRAAPGIVAGLNYVGPEDFRVSLRDYSMHMRWIGFLAGSDVPVALHAGELWLGLVPPPDLAFHIREAVEVAGARRIGHGTAVGFERDSTGLLAQMHRRGVAVEIALTSSDVILGVRGRAHPITTYLAARVPVTLATDDAGVSRIDLTNEYVRAARDHGLGYRQLKGLARNALLKAFLPEAERRAALERLDGDFAAFEQDVAAAMPPLARAAALVRALMPGGR